MKKKILALGAVFVIAVMMLAGCKKSSESNSATGNYDAKEVVAKYNLPEIPEKDKNFKVQMGYNDCDHMIGAIIGEEAGIYKALGLNVTVTKTNNTNIAQAMTTGEMHVGYMGLTGAVRSVNEGAPIMMAAANHLGGSRYLVVSNDIKEPKDLVGKTIAIAQNSEQNPEWIDWAETLNVPVELKNYKVVEMSQKDCPLALQSKKIDAFACCDPYASMCEYEDYGKVMAIGWGAHIDEDLETGWGMCCIYGMNENFRKEHPEIATRLVLAHGLAIQYLYEHPYEAGMMFAKGFGTAPEVGLMTVYMKTVAEGRTITWEFTEENLNNYINYYKDYQIDEKYVPMFRDKTKFMEKDLITASGLGLFQDFIKEKKIDENFPIRMSYKDWLKKAKEIDGIQNDVGEDFETPEVYTKSQKLVAYENRVNVCTNSPAFPTHIKRLESFNKNILQDNPAKNLPGSFDPVSRFIKAYHLNQGHVKAKHRIQAYEQAYSVLEAMKIPQGFIRNSSHHNTYTRYTCAYDTECCELTVRTHTNPTIYRLSFDDFQNAAKRTSVFLPKKTTFQSLRTTECSVL